MQPVAGVGHDVQEREARAVGDSQAIELSAKNAALKFSTRTGPSQG